MSALDDNDNVYALVSQAYHLLAAIESRVADHFGDADPRSHELSYALQGVQSILDDALDEINNATEAEQKAGEHKADIIDLFEVLRQKIAKNEENRDGGTASVPHEEA